MNFDDRLHCGGGGNCYFLHKQKLCQVIYNISVTAQNALKYDGYLW